MKKNIFLRTRSCLLSAFITFFGASLTYAQKTGTPVTVPVIIQQLSTQKKTLRSVDFSVIENRMIVGVQKEPVQSSYAWAFDGKRIMKKRQVGIQLNVTSFDGKQEEDRLYNGRNEQFATLLQVTYASKGFITTNAPSPLIGGYRIQDRWLSDIVATGKFKVSVGQIDEQYGKTYVLEGVGNDNAQYRFVIAPQYGWTCIRSFQQIRSTTNKAVTMQNITKINTLQNYKGLWLPKSLETHRLYDNEISSKMTPFEDAKLDITVNRLNDLPPSYFNLPPLSEGCAIVDRDTMTRYRLKNGKRVREAGPLTSRDNFWRWGFAACIATGVFGAVTFGLSKVSPAKTPPLR